MEFKRQLITTNGKASKYLEMLRGYHTCFFADDLLLFGKASVAQARVMERILQDFCYTTGQKVNLAKSRIWYSGNTTHTMIHAITQHFGIPATSNPRLYLGVPIVHGRMTGHYFQIIIDLVMKKLEKWQSKILSRAARLLLIQSVCLAIPAYVMNVCKLPVRVVAQLEKVF